MIAPLTFELQDIEPPDERHLNPGECLVHFRAGAVCGSDMPLAKGLFDSRTAGARKPGWPMHEVLGEVILSDDPALQSGDRVVGWAMPSRGLSERFVTPSSRLTPVTVDLPDIEAVMVQSMACVLSAFDRVGQVEGRSVAVLGLGPFGLLIAAVARELGASEVIGVDPLHRDPEILRLAGVTSFVLETSREWVTGLAGEKPDIVFEAVGHQISTLSDAISAVRPGGTVFMFGVPDDTYYPLPFREMFIKNVSLLAGETSEHRRFLNGAQTAIPRYRELIKCLITDVFPYSEAQDAYRLAANPASGRLKVIISAGRS